MIGRSPYKDLDAVLWWQRLFCIFMPNMKELPSVLLVIFDSEAVLICYCI